MSSPAELPADSSTLPAHPRTRPSHPAHSARLPRAGHRSAEALQRQLAAARPTAGQLAPGIAFGILSGLSAVLLIGLSAYLITRAAEQPPILYLGLLVVGVRAFALSRAFFRYLERLSTHDAAFRLLGTLRTDIFARLEPLAPVRLSRHRRGDLLTRVVTDVDQLIDWPVRVIQPLVTSTTVVLVTLLCLAYFSPTAAGVLAVMLAAALACGTVISAAVTDRAEARTAGLRGQLADAVTDLVTDLDVLIAYDAVDTHVEKVRRADAQLRAAALCTSFGAGLVAAAMALAAGLAVVLTLVVGLPQLVPSDPLGPGFRLSPGTIDGPVLALLALVPLVVFEVVAAVSAAWTARRRVLASAERIAAIAPPVEGEAVDNQGADSAPVRQARRSGAAGTVRRNRCLAGRRSPRAGEVILENFAVFWPGSRQPVSAPVTVSLRPGENLLVTGASGAGKTAFAYGLVGFVPHSGDYRISGYDAGTLTGEQLRRRVCLIEQSAHLFDGTLRANLALAHPEGPEAATDEDLHAVVQAVGLTEWAASREGLDTRVGMNGELISGGQAQRIAVARGLLSRAEVLILDEPTAHVDPAAAETMLTELLDATAERTVVVISHLPVDPHRVDHHLQITRADSEG
ncbi:thiol reductant ABC exporter subunit CydC [Nesterenkonia alba]|uniref:thiol reductant ABC exporter subunit CydC n=1 Tax=Nesterenkonia alba TaxID=515814 RepID=UPI000426FEE7|nr:thiol reductant ABC exporter subunit CydC [Nesterenkonia alba]